jgi:hypothetical protein
MNKNVKIVGAIGLILAAKIGTYVLLSRLAK